MRILHVYSGVYTGGGIIKKIINLAKNDTANTHELLFIWYSDPMNKRFEMMTYLDNAKIKFNYTYHKSIWLNIPWVLRFFKRNHYDLIHFYTDNVMVIGKIVKVLGAKPKYVRSLEGAPMYTKFPTKQLINWALTSSNDFISISEYVKNAYLTTYSSLKGDNISVVYNALVHRLERHKTQSERDGIICVGTLTDQKQFDNAIKTIAILKDSYHKKIPLYILGNGNDKEKLQCLAKTLKIDDLIHFVGNVNNPEAYYDRCKLFIHPAYNEGFGLVVLEAMKMEMGILVANSGALSEIVEEGKTGYILPLRNPEVWAKKINELYDQDSLLDKMGKEALRVVESTFSLKQHIDGYTDFYYSVK